MPERYMNRLVSVWSLYIIPEKQILKFHPLKETAYFSKKSGRAQIECAQLKKSSTKVFMQT